MMPGLAKTSAFQFTTASILIGPMVDGPTLNTKDHSIGLTKNLQLSVETGFVELTQGVVNQVVASMVNKQDVKASAEIYEFTARNMAYGLGLDATSATAYLPFTEALPLSAAVAAAATTFKTPTDQSVQFPAGAWGFLQEGLDDAVHLFKVASSAFVTPDTTVTMTGFPVPTSSSGFSIANGRCGLLNKVDSDPAAANQMFAVRIVGITAMDKRPVAIHMPKCKITKGFAMNFSSDNWSNLPFEFNPYVPVPTDPGYSADFSKILSVFTPN